jgi:hypothetical protein
VCISVDYYDIRIKNASQGPVFCLFRYFVVYYELTNHIRLGRACRFARFAITHQDRPSGEYINARSFSPGYTESSRLATKRFYAQLAQFHFKVNRLIIKKNKLCRPSTHQNCF